MSSTQVEAQAIVQPQAAEGTAAADVDPTTAAAAALSVFAPADAAAKELKLTEIRAATSRKMFDSVDADNSGFIEYDEFQRLCRKLDVTMSANDMKLAMSLLDEDSSGAISFEECGAHQLTCTTSSLTTVHGVVAGSRRGGRGRAPQRTCDGCGRPSPSRSAAVVMALTRLSASASKRRMLR
eukprot:COSAG01_NODE_3808_length_5677_cov_7.172643_3_plen_182_part_00